MRPYTGLPPEAYHDAELLELEQSRLLRRAWQWVGIVDNLRDPGGIAVDIAGLPIAVEGDPDRMSVSLNTGSKRQKIEGAVADRCGRFLFVKLDNSNPESLSDFLGGYADVLRHCSEDFSDVYEVGVYEWECNWKAGLEVTLEGYHVPYVHAGPMADEPVQKKAPKQKASNFVQAVPKSCPPVYSGPHSYLCGLIGDQMRTEMANIAKRLKIATSRKYFNYDHFTLFPNMTAGFSGGNLCFMQIYTPLGPNRMQLRYVYILAKLADPAQKPVPIIRETLLSKWRDYTKSVLSEDQTACEQFQIGVRYATRPGLIGRKAEERVAHFHKYWRQVMGIRAKLFKPDQPALRPNLRLVKITRPAKTKTGAAAPKRKRA